MQEIGNVQGVIWDLDGTLLNSRGVFDAVLEDVTAVTGHQMPTAEDIDNNYHGTLEETIGRLLGIESIPELENIIELFLSHQERHYEEAIDSHLYKDAVYIAQQAAHLYIPQLLVTNRAHGGRGYASPRAIIEATILFGYIHRVNPGDEVAFRKPDKRAVGDWMEQTDTTPEGLLVIGDQAVDAELALNLGARAVLVERGGKIPHLSNLAHDQRDHITIVDDLSLIRITRQYPY